MVLVPAALGCALCWSGWGKQKCTEHHGHQSNARLGGVEVLPSKPVLKRVSLLVPQPV